MLSIASTVKSQHSRQSSRRPVYSRVSSRWRSVVKPVIKIIQEHQRPKVLKLADFEKELREKLPL